MQLAYISQRPKKQKKKRKSSELANNFRMVMKKKQKKILDAWLLDVCYSIRVLLFSAH